MSELEIKQVMGCSTGHITKEDDEILTNFSGSELTVIKHEYGYMIGTGHGTEQEDWPKPFKEANLSAHFFNVLMLARFNDCKWVDFDRDASTIDGLTVHDW